MAGERTGREDTDPRARSGSAGSGRHRCREPLSEQVDAAVEHVGRFVVVEVRAGEQLEREAPSLHALGRPDATPINQQWQRSGAS
jgi:hypothetical protein